MSVNSTNSLELTHLKKLSIDDLNASLKSVGVKKGDRDCLYMPMIPELAYAVLACARIGAVHSVVFAGFSSKSLADRINDASCRFLVTADGGFRGNKITPLKEIADEALKQCDSSEKVIVVNRCKLNIDMVEGRDIWWNSLYENQPTFSLVIILFLLHF